MLPLTTNLLYVAPEHRQVHRPNECSRGSSVILTFGPDMDAGEDFRLRTNLQNKVAIPSDLQVLTVISDSLSWTKERNDIIRDWLPSSVKKYNVIVVDPRCRRHCEARVSTCYYEGIPTSIVSYIAFPIDEVDEELAHAIIQLPSLKELTIRNSKRPSFLEKDFTFLFRMLSSFSTLEVVCISLSDGENIEDILIALQLNHPNLTRLALLVSPSFHLGVLLGPSKAAFENAIMRGLESFTQLERLIITQSLSNDLLLESLGRLPRLKDLRFMADPVVTEDQMFNDLRASFST
ncbi:hypothetical protein BJ912DRAFT_1043195 [Pholiota molesta]|nr:hypothetical protein BJ912DRAFT_1043195 [Pholiota molesta]